MQQPTLHHQLTTEEMGLIRVVLDNQHLMSALRKVWEKEADYWEMQMRQEALSGKKFEERASRVIEYAAKAEQAIQTENVMRKAVGL